MALTIAPQVDSWGAFSYHQGPLSTGRSRDYLCKTPTHQHGRTNMFRKSAGKSHGAFKKRANKTARLNKASPLRGGIRL